MNIVCLNQPYLTHPKFAAVILEQGHRVFSIGWRAGEFDCVPSKEYLTLDELLALLPEGFTPDAIVYFDTSEVPKVFGLESAPCLTVFHSVDVHIHKHWHQFWALSFDHFLLAMKGYAEVFEGAYAPPTTWFPLWAFSAGAEPASHRPVAASFRGSFGITHPRRRAFFDGVKAQIDGDFGTGPFFELYSRSKIVLNDCIRDDLNWRVFEALASGALLITPRVSPETLELFPENEALVTYRPHDVDDAVQKVRYYLSHETKRLRIAQNGYERVRSTHMAHHRAKTLLGLLASSPRRPEVTKTFCAALTYFAILQLRAPALIAPFTSALTPTLGRLRALYEHSGVSAEQRDKEELALRQLAEQTEGYLSEVVSGTKP
ncbi:MAG: glycosyltransferase family 1 protein [Proteobacteria bacterium]|nr:glycosyltransferase family 1 protein [Pseudomonadota bacterium]